MTDMIITIGIVDNDTITVQALRMLLERVDCFRVLWTAQSGREAIAECLNDDHWPDVLLIDAELGDMRGTRLCHQLRISNARTGILIITAYPLEYFTHEAAQAGAQGIVGKADYPWLARAIQVISNGRPFINPRIPTDFTDRRDRTQGTDSDMTFSSFENAAVAHLRLIEAAKHGTDTTPVDSLSHQEAQVLSLSAAGLTQNEIADHLIISAASVRTHSSRARRKLNATTLIQAVVTWVTGDHRD